MQHVLQQTTLELIIRLTTGSQRRRGIHFNQPTTETISVLKSDTDITQVLERLSMTFTANGKKQK